MLVRMTTDRNMLGLCGKLVFTLALCGVAGAGGGCENSQMIAENESILAPMFAQPDPTEAVDMAFDAYDADARYSGVTLLASAPWGGQPKYLELYQLRTEDESAIVRAAAAKALGRHGLPEQVGSLTLLLRDDETFVRLAAAQALQRVHSPQAIGALIESLDKDNERDADVRAEVADALGQYAEPRVLQALIAALDDESLAVTRRASESLTTLTGEDFGDNRRAWTGWALDTRDQFAGQTAYVYPVFERDKRWIEYIPFYPPVPNEIASNPVGMPRVEDEGGTQTR